MRTVTRSLCGHWKTFWNEAARKEFFKLRKYDSLEDDEATELALIRFEGIFLECILSFENPFLMSLSCVNSKTGQLKRETIRNQISCEPKQVYLPGKKFQIDFKIFYKPRIQAFIDALLKYFETLYKKGRFCRIWTYGAYRSSQEIYRRKRE